MLPVNTSTFLRSFAGLRACSICCLAFLALAACGGGGGGGGGSTGSNSTSSGSSNGGSDNSEPPPPEPTGKVAITDVNVVELASIAFVHTEYLHLNAELMVSATLLVQLIEDGFLSTPCPDDLGSLTLEHVDSDDDGYLSSGDRVELDYMDCGSANGSMTLDITSVAQTGATLDRLTGTVIGDLVISGDDFDLSLESNQNISYSVDTESVVWQTLDGSVTSAALGTEFSVNDTSITYTIDVDADTYELDFSGVATVPDGDYDFETVEPFASPRGSYPEQGYADLNGENSAGRVLHTDDPEDRPTLAQYQVDETGSGEFGGITYVAWDDLFIGAFFAPDSSDNYVPIPGVWDLTSRRQYLEGISSDVVMDDTRGQLYFSITDRNEIAVVDSASLLVIDRIPVGSAPEGMWLSSSGDILYVALSLGGSIGALDIDARTVEYIDVASALGNPFAYDVVEASPGVLFVASNPGPGGIGYLAKIDRGAGDVVTRVVDERLVRDEPALAVDPNGEFLIAGDGSQLLKIDISDPVSSLVLERSISAGRNLSLSPDGIRLYLWSGEILDTSTFEDLGVLEPGVPYALDNGLEVLIARDDFKLSIYDAQTRIHIDLLSTGCGLSTDINTVIPYGDFGQWLMLGDLGFCAVDFYNPGEAPGSDMSNPAVDELEPVSVTSETITVGSGIEDVEYDYTRNRIYASDSFENQIYSLDADTFDVIETFSLDGKPFGIDLNPDSSHLAIAIRNAVPLSILDLTTGTVENLDISAALGRSVAFDVSYVGDDAIFVSGDTGDAYLVRAYANGDPAIRIADDEMISNNATQAADPANQRLYVAEWYPYTVYALDIGQELAPIVASYQIDEDPSSLGISLSPDGMSFAISQGVVLRTNDLTQRGMIGEGTPVFAADGSSIAVDEGGGNIHLFDTVNFTETIIVAPACDVSSSVKLVQFGGKNDWALIFGNQICRFSLPTVGTQMTKLQNQYDRKVTAPYVCDSDCVSRRLVIPRFGSSVNRDYSKLVPRDLR